MGMAVTPDGEGYWLVASYAGMSAPPGYTAQQMIFDDQFSGTSLDTTKWSAFMGAQGDRWDGGGSMPLPSPYSTGSALGGTDYEMYAPSQAVVNNGLTINAERNPLTQYSATYPWLSGCITTMGKFALPTSGWYVQVKAKLPDMTQGMWPGVWFLPAQRGTAFNELDFIQGGFTGAGPVNQVNAFDYFAPGGEHQSDPNIGVDLTSGYHVWGIEWTPGVGIKAWVDGNLVWSATASSSLSIPSQPYEIILNLQVASQQTSGWHTVPSATSPGGSLKVAEVQAYS